MKKSNKKNNPEEILYSIKREEFIKQRGKLKIFFGMAAGVGKTYAMLSYAQSIKKEGLDIAIGFIETHGRADTQKLVEGLEIIPRKKINYRGLIFEEMDTDAIIVRKPHIVLIDELAHTNITGSRHLKRYLDILEILDYGIDVYTTLNIQHLESYSITVEEITGIKVTETVPDLIFEYADNIELIDITPEELLKRLADGKVYTKEKSKTAIENFFKKENLTALRELSLRYTAKKVDRQLQEFLKIENKIWKTGERLLVAVSPSPNSQYLIKWAKRISFNLKADWFVVHVENRNILNEKEDESLKNNLDLARQLGAEVIITSDDDIVEGILKIAYQKNISQIIVGKSYQNYRFLQKITGRNIIDRLLKESGEIDIYIVTEPGIKIKPSKNHILNFKGHHFKTSYKEYLISCLIIIAVTFLNYIINHFTGYWTIGLIYLSAISISGIFLSKGPIILSATISAILWNLLFIPPRFTFYIGKIEDMFMFIMYFVIALISGNLTSKLHLNEQALKIREKYISELYEMSSTISNTFELDDIIKYSINFIEKFLGAKAVFFIADNFGNLIMEPHKESNYKIDENEYTRILWSFYNKKPSGKFTDTLPVSDLYYQPLNGASGIYGIIGLYFSEVKTLKYDFENFVNNIVHLIAIAIERIYLIEKMQEIKISVESEKLYKIILNSISHELKTPLTSIANAANGLNDNKMFSIPKTRKILLEDIIESTERMNGIVGNLLNMVRLESGKLKLHREWNDINDVVNSAIKKADLKLKNYNFKKDISDNLPLLYIDFGLIEQVISNILLNAMQHNSEGIEIILKIYLNNDKIFFIIKDNGRGIPDYDLNRIFDKFYRVSKTNTGGTGIGLSICKSIIELHNGRIYAQNNPDGGVSFIFYLPVDKNINTEKL